MSGEHPTRAQALEIVDRALEFAIDANVMHEDVDFADADRIARDVHAFGGPVAIMAALREPAFCKCGDALTVCVDCELDERRRCCLRLKATDANGYCVTCGSDPCL